VRVSQLKQWNNLGGNDLKIGQRLTIYPRNPQGQTHAVAAKKSIDLKGKEVYQVKQGDTLWTIAQKFPGVSVQNLKEWNDISGTNLSIGANLVVSK
jgi:membrane-bound lytic murein transglycosylase D